MEKETMAQILNMLDCPAFSVEDGTIRAVNLKAQQRFFAEDTPVSNYFQSDVSLYLDRSWTELFVTLSVKGKAIGANVTKVENYDVFRLDSDDDMAKFQAMSLVSEMLRAPLNSILPVTATLLDSTENADRSILEVRRSLHEIIRMVNNISDVTLGEKFCRSCEMLNLTALFDELLEKCSALLEETDYRIHYTGLPKLIFGIASQHLLEQSVYSLISNAIKFSDKGSTIDVKVSTEGNKLLFSVTNPCGGVKPDIMKNIFTMYRREPHIEDPRHGLGLGLVIVRMAALLHNGTVLIDQDGKNIRFTLVIEIRKNGTPSLRNKPIYIDTTGGLDPALIALSDILPSSVYKR